MHRLDYPPVWLAGFVALAVMIAWLVPWSVSGPWPAVAGGTLLCAGVLLMVLAAPSFIAGRTTIVPHREPDALITGGLYRLTRNPIYLGDVLVLAGAALLLRAPEALVLVPPFMWVLRRRFIDPEEARLRRAFGAQFDAYARRTRRWL